MPTTQELDKYYSQLLNTFVHKTPEEFSRVSKKVATIVKDEYIDYDGRDQYIPYPEYTDKNFNKVIFNKKEFNRNRLSKPYGKKTSDFDKASQEKCSQSIFTLTPNQKFIKGFMSPLTPYNGLLLFHSVGVGKTCTAISIAEQYHDIYEKKVLVILSSTLIDNFKKQIFDITKYDLKTNTANLCTGTKYPDMVIDTQRMDNETLERKINKLINEKYQFIGYKELALLMDKIRNKIEQYEVHNDPDKVEKLFNERLSDIFSDRLIIIDEAHNLRNPSETGKKQISTAFKTLLSHVTNVKLVLLTATPMFNNAKEIVWTLNLLLTNDKRPELTVSMLFDAQGNLTDKGKDVLLRVSRGYVSFMRGENPFSFPFRLYPSINDDQNVLKIYPRKDIYGKKITKDNHIKHLDIVVSSMSVYQKQVYDVLKRKLQKTSNVDDDEDSEEDDEENDEQTINNDIQSTMQISNIVYPSVHAELLEKKDVTFKDMKKYFFGNGGLEQCFNINDKGKMSYKNDIKKQYGEFLTYESIHEYAPKIKSTLDYIIKSKGIVFVYSRYYGAGIIPIALALEHIGFSKYSRSGDSSNLASNITINDKFAGKRPKYIVISRNKKLSPNNDLDIAAAKAISNKEGENIKVIIVSKVGTEGIDFKRIREIHILEPWFNLNRAEQIIGRGVRFCSHIDLPKSKRNVTIMFHGATYDQNEESVDLRTYRIAENKQKRIYEIENILKKNSIDCKLNKNSLVFPAKKLNISFDIETSQGKTINNFRVGDLNYSQACGYGECIASCFDDDSVHGVDSGDNLIDDTTFNKSFILDDIDIYKRFVGKVYASKHKYFTFEQILRTLQDEYASVDEEILMYTLDDMITNKTVISDEHGRLGYLIYRGNNYLLQRFKISDTRMSLEERDDEMAFRRNIPVKGILQHLNKQDAQVKANNQHVSNVKSENTIAKDDPVLYINQQLATSTSSVASVIVGGLLAQLHTNTIKGVLQLTKDNSDTELENLITDVCKYPNDVLKPNNEAKDAYAKMVSILGKVHDPILDSVIDRLERELYEGLINVLAKKKNKGEPLNELEGMCLRSLIMSGVIIPDNENQIKYYFNHFEGELFCQKTNGQFKKCYAIDLVKINAEHENISNMLKTGVKATTKAYLTKANEQEIPNFKIKDNEKTSGYVCQKTSSLTVNDLKKRIETIIPGLLEKAKVKYTKSSLCYVYEILMRAYLSDKFQRPHFLVKIDSKK